MTKQKYQDDCHLCSHKFYCDHNPFRDNNHHCLSFNSIYLLEYKINKIINKEIDGYDVYNYTYITDENRHRFLKFIDKILEIIENNKKKKKPKSLVLNDIIQMIMLMNLEDRGKKDKKKNKYETE